MGEEKPQLFCFHFKIKWTQQMLRQFLRSVHSFVCTHYIRFNLHCKKREFGKCAILKTFLTLCKLTRQAFLQDKWPKNISVGFSHFKGGLKTIYQKDKNPLTKFLSSLLRVEEEFSWENILSKIRNFLASLLTVPIVKIILFFFS